MALVFISVLTSWSIYIAFCLCCLFPGCFWQVLGMFWDNVGVALAHSGQFGGATGQQENKY